MPGFISNSDLTTRQYVAVKFVGTTGLHYAIDRTTAASDRPVGILQNDPSSSQAAEVATPGMFARARYGGTVVVGNTLSTDANGALVAVAPDSTGLGAIRYLIALALEDGADSEIHDVLVIGPIPVRST